MHKLNRRHFLSASATSMALGIPWLRNAAASTQMTMSDLHNQVEKRAIAIANGKEITLSALIPGGSSANVKPVADAFTKATGIAIRIVEAPVDDINTRMLIDALSQLGEFDIALPASFGLPDLVESEALINLDEFAARHAPKDFQQDALYTLGSYFQGGLYGYQTDGDVYLMFYNKKFLDDADEQARFADRHGYPLAVPQTWEQLDTMMEFFHRPDQDRYGGALFRTPNYMAWEWWIRFHAKGRWPFTEEMEPNIDGPAGVAALEEMLAAARYLYPEAKSDGLFANWEAYSKGNIFCNIGWGGTQKYLNSSTSPMRGNMLFGPTPGGIIDGKPLQTSYFNWGWNFTVPKSSKYAELAYLYTLYSCSPVMSTIAVREADGFFDPFREEHYKDKIVQDSYSAEFLKVHHQSMKRSIPDLYLSGQGEYLDALKENIQRAASGELAPERALNLCAKQWRQTTRSKGRENQIRQWQFLRGSYPKSVSALLM